MTIVYTYNSLTEALREWPEEDNSEYVAELPDIIAQGEMRTLRDLNLTIFDTRDTALSMTSGDRLVTKPTDWFVTRSVHIVVSNSRIRLIEKTYDWCIDYAPNASVEDQPKYIHELNDTQWYVVPTPDEDYATESHHGARPAGLASGNQNTWLGDQAGDLLHAACMVPAAKFLKMWEAVNVWETTYQTFLGTARMEFRDLIRSDYSPVKTTKSA